ncbi:hypothetical protein [Cetobacterium sp. SF1]|uniref:hypothetical protein n=1 Tax=Cetobacterium sp. SF1 TaxID=3417654 RepID=UPI003CF8741B
MKKTLLLAGILMTLVGCSAVTGKKAGHKIETNVKPTSVAVLPANRGTLNDLQGVNLFGKDVADKFAHNKKGIKVQNSKTTLSSLKEKEGITVAGQLSGVDKAQLEKELSVDGLMYIQMESMKVSLEPKLVNFKPAGAIVKSINANVEIFNDGKLYAEKSIEEKEETVITLEQLNNLKNTVVLVNEIVSEITKNPKASIGTMVAFGTLVADLKKSNPDFAKDQLAVIYDALPTEQLVSIFSDLFKKAGVIKGHPFEKLINKAAAQVQTI